ncbi:uncharacterized protein L3040_008252 [Drepanopeziza brunnea f. sp. 'multigermtubi']|uniref:uncharacterized protein n=1 Tax=Drepanopeziza brunnea f. sp. 'multigermtubi' TaxID=698441 RepID=UPI00238A88CE|nr:hypothetical protein L3040_008252 [Drepanopeziza brunnea f. sp. 'multigermtubi']
MAPASTEITSCLVIVKSHILHTYDDPLLGENFVLPGHVDYEAGPAVVAHIRALGFLKKRLGGPYFDLEAIRDGHCRLAFAERDVKKTMVTIVLKSHDR